MNTKMELLINLLDCGSLDIDKLTDIIDTCEDFQGSALEWAIQEIKDNNMELNVNTLMYNLLDTLEYNLINKIKNELNIELSEDDFELFINYMDTHITYMGENEQVKNWLENNCELVEF